MKESIITRYLEKKSEREIYPDFKNMLELILERYDLSIFERIVYTFSRDGKIIIDMKIVELDNMCLALVNEFVRIFNCDLMPIDYSEYSEIFNFVNKYAKKENVDEHPKKIVGDNIDIKYFNNVDNFNNYLKDILTNNFH
ncbi:MAG: hypothetical protein IJ997_01420 [Mycoplasmataceae bacterium]|nr:hypothetical protein [Mycoplasmataceae bacterium]